MFIYIKKVFYHEKCKNQIVIKINDINLIVDINLIR